MRCFYILFYHRILLQNLKTFEKQLKILNYTTNIIDIDEIENKPFNSALITFDDGYYDNFVFAYPLLKKYKLKATIFLITSKIKENGVRKTLLDYWNGKVALKDLMNSNNDYLTWEEIEIMYKSGIIKFHPHSHTHYSHFISDKIVEKFQRKVKNLNINWQREFYYEIAGLFKGFEYIPSEKRFETISERKKRLKEEFLKPKELIKKYLGYESTHFCWPWGEYDKVSIDIGKEFGYKFFYTTNKGVICESLPYEEIPRISASSNMFTFLKRNFIYSNRYFARLFNLNY